MSSIRKKRPGPTLKSRTRGWKGRSKGGKKQKQEGPVIPVFSRTPLSEPGPCGRQTCKDEVCSRHCKEARGHKIDWRFAGWAKGHGDGTFDVSCKLCGMIGTAKVELKATEVLWV